MNQGNLWDELDADTIWVHVLRSTPLDAMGINAIAVYVMLKTYTDLNNGTAFPGVDTLAERLKTSRDTVERALRRLRELKLLDWDKDPENRKRNRYRFTEQLPLVTKSDRTPAGTASVPYVPTGLQDFLNELKAFAKNGTPTGPQIVINLSLQIGDNNVQNVQNVVVEGSSVSQDAIAEIKRKLAPKS